MSPRSLAKIIAYVAGFDIALAAILIALMGG